jgi:pantoate--beta-alanine ligase
MYIFKTVQDLQNYLTKQKDKEIGFVPTMGALHLGHLSLIENSLSKNDVVVCSIYVNPTQFGDAQDLDKYPRPIESDIEKLEKLGCHVLFLPSNEEIYPDNLVEPKFDLSGLDKTMEGAQRPGHFAGVVRVIHRFLYIVKPQSLFMGQKDYQQFAVIKHLLKLMQSPIELVCVAIVRENDGLAMSSRNIRLSQEGRIKARLISKTLFQAKEDAKTLSLLEVKQKAIDYLSKNEMEVDYFEVIDGESLQSIQTFNQAATVTACTTVRVDGVRLLDNIILKENNF